MATCVHCPTAVITRLSAGARCSSGLIADLAGIGPSFFYYFMSVKKLYLSLSLSPSCFNKPTKTTTQTDSPSLINTFLVVKLPVSDMNDAREAHPSQCSRSDALTLILVLNGTCALNSKTYSSEKSTLSHIEVSSSTGYSGMAETGLIGSCRSKDDGAGGGGSGGAVMTTSSGTMVED